MEQKPGATVTASAIGAVSAFFIGIPVAVLIWSCIRLAANPGEPELILFSVLFALIWGFTVMAPSSLLLGAIGGAIALKLARWLQGTEFIVGVAVCGALLGAFNGAWVELLGTGDESLLIVVGAITGALTGPIAGLIIRRVCTVESVGQSM